METDVKHLLRVLETRIKDFKPYTKASSKCFNQQGYSIKLEDCTVHIEESQFVDDLDSGLQPRSYLEIVIDYESGKTQTLSGLAIYDVKNELRRLYDQIDQRNSGKAKKKMKQIEKASHNASLDVLAEN